MNDTALNTSEIVRRQVSDLDHDRYQLIVTCPKGHQRRLLALAAFNCELSQCLTATTETMLSHIKLQWWAEALEEASAGRVRRHPILEEMATCKVDFTACMPLVDARIEELERDSKPTLQSSLDYASDTSGQLLALMADSQDQSIHSLLLSVGQAWGLLALLRALLFQTALSKGLVPEDILQHLDGEDHFTGDIKLVIETAGQSIMAEVDKLLSSASQTAKHLKLSPLERSLVKQGIMARHYCTLIKKGRYDPAQINFSKGQLSLLIKLLFTRF